MIRKTLEDYMRAIYSVYETQDDKNKGVRPVDIAKMLKISKPSVSAAMKKLRALGLVNFKPYSNVFFTKKGAREARRATHNYRVIEVFLTTALGYKKSELAEEAHKLEHAFSEKAIKRLDKFVGNPKRCPHGSVIHE